MLGLLKNIFGSALYIPMAILWTFGAPIGAYIAYTHADWVGVGASLIVPFAGAVITVMHLLGQWY